MEIVPKQIAAGILMIYAYFLDFMKTILETARKQNDRSGKLLILHENLFKEVKLNGFDFLNRFCNSPQMWLKQSLAKRFD